LDEPIQGVCLTNEDLNLLYDLSTSIHAIDDLDKMLRSILKKMKSVFDIEGASIALHDSESNEFYFIRTAEEQRDGADEKMFQMRFSDNYGVAGWVYHHKQPVTIPDVSNDDRYSADLDIQKDFITRSMICVPLKSRNEIIGVLYALNKRNGHFSRKDSLLLEILSGTIAIAVENAKLYGDIKAHADNLEKENLRLMSEVRDRFNLQGIIGSSPAMKKVFELLDKVVGTMTTVFIQGETGTGKELFAKAIHYNSPFKGKPFVAENCGALTENLLESELFGHVRGAFTGAVVDKKGLFEMAEGGTVFLDEIADMPHTMQTKILRVLQEGQVRPVGGNRYQKVDFRLIASSNRDLLAEVKKGRFRDDLYYRLHVFPIVLPPLRNRKEDIPVLVDHFIKKLSAKFKRPKARLAPPALELMMQFDWPGNIRELENEIERAMTLAGADQEIQVAYLSEKITGSRLADLEESAENATLQEAVQRIERHMVKRALQSSGGNRSQAARHLGLTRQGLLNKINRYQIKSL
jgi:Nif-specific regulatory protein